MVLVRVAVRFVALWCIALAAAGCGGRERQVRALPPPTTGEQNVEAAGPVVDVAGAVRRPGVYRMPVGARVHEAIAAAGGLAPGARVEGLNRAAAVVDGQQVLVPTSAADDERAGRAGTGSPVTVSINAADVAQLDTLPGIGPVTAQRIVDERTSRGPFASVDDLDRVPGIGPATIESIREVATT